MIKKQNKTNKKSKKSKSKKPNNIINNLSLEISLNYCLKVNDCNILRGKC